MYLGARQLQAADRQSIETEVEKEARLEKNRFRLLHDRRAGEIQKEKEACFEEKSHSKCQPGS